MHTAMIQGTIKVAGNQSKFTFVDLFAGIGGFRLALQELGGRCIFSSEWDKECQNTYEYNFGERPSGDITKSHVKRKIPDTFDVLTAGFPCQPFSKGGGQSGFSDARGTLFYDVCTIIDKHIPKLVLLENVPNLVTHDSGRTYKVITEAIHNLGYLFPKSPLILSPDQFGVPILRKRLFIPCIRKDMVAHSSSLIEDFANHIKDDFVDRLASIDTILDQSVEDTLSDYEKSILDMWDVFIMGIEDQVIGFPIWSDFFRFNGNMEGLPKWKIGFIEKNIDLYIRNKNFIDWWFDTYHNLIWCRPTHRKMEWQAGSEYKSVYDCFIQFRPSGIRVKRPDKFSTLVAMNHRQIIGKLQRKLSVIEAKRLQSFPENYVLISSPNEAFKQLGNTVNVKVVREMASKLIDAYLL